MVTDETRQLLTQLSGCVHGIPDLFLIDIDRCIFNIDMTDKSHQLFQKSLPYGQILKSVFIFTSNDRPCMDAMMGKTGIGQSTF